MNSIQDIRSLLKTDIEAFDLVFKQALRTKVPLLNLILKHQYKQKGKGLRPIFVFLSAYLHGKTGAASHRAAAMIELLHTATLIHDDVVDDANQRRGLFSIKALWKNKAAVLVGDYILSQGLLLSLQAEDYTALQIVSRATKEMSEGELLQIEKSRRLDITEEVYFDIIRKKTASLLASCCAIGAASAGASKAQTEQMWQLGEKIGLAFQIQDDIFDYTAKGQTIGKPIGIDIKEKKLTLPLIYMLSQCSPKEQRQWRRRIKKDHKRPHKVKEIIKEVIDAGGIDYAQQKMQTLYTEVINILDTFENSPYKLAMQQLVGYCIKREK